MVVIGESVLNDGESVIGESVINKALGLVVGEEVFVGGDAVGEIVSEEVGEVVNDEVGGHVIEVGNDVFELGEEVGIEVVENSEGL